MVTAERMNEMAWNLDLNKHRHQAIIFKEMCERVNLSFWIFDFKDPFMLCKYRWTRNEELDFQSWLTDYLYNNVEARREIMTVWSKNKRNCKEAAKWFIFEFGWSYKGGGH